MIRGLSRFLLGGYRHLPRSMWALFLIQVVLRGGDFVFPFLTLFLTRRLGFSGAEAGLWIMANVASGLLGTLVAGKVSDHLGRKLVLAACMVGTGLLTGSCGFLPPSMLIPRVLVLAAFFQGSMKPIIAAIIMDLCPQDTRKEAFSLSYLGVNLGVAIGPMFAGFLFENHLPWVFFGNSLALALSLLLLLRLIPELPPEHVQGEEGSERAVGGSAFRAFLERPLLVVFCLITLFVSFAYGQTTFGLTLYTSEFFGASGAAKFGFLMSFNAIVVLGSTAVLTRLTQHLSGPMTMGLGAGFMAAGFAMMAFRLGMVLLTVSVLIWTLGEVLLATNSGAYLGSHTPRNFRGRFQSIRELLSSAGRLLSPVVFGAIITGAGIRVSWLVTALVALGCAAGFGMLHRWDSGAVAPEPQGDPS
jgi:MFS family permease